MYLYNDCEDINLIVLDMGTLKLINAKTYKSSGSSTKLRYNDTLHISASNMMKNSYLFQDYRPNVQQLYA